MPSTAYLVNGDHTSIYNGSRYSQPSIMSSLSVSMCLPCHSPPVAVMSIIISIIQNIGKTVTVDKTGDWHHAGCFRPFQLLKWSFCQKLLPFSIRFRSVWIDLVFIKWTCNYSKHNLFQFDSPELVCLRDSSPGPSRQPRPPAWPRPLLPLPGGSHPQPAEIRGQCR